MTSPYTPTRVLDTSEARKGLSRLAAKAREQGARSEIVFCGPYRHPDLAIVPAALLEIIGPYIEDILIAERVSTRRAECQGGGVSPDELIESLGVSDEDVEAAVARIEAASIR